MIILTGGAGFIGSNILRGLNDLGFDQVLVVDDIDANGKLANLESTKYLDLVAKEDFYCRLERGDWNSSHIEAICHQGACTDTTIVDLGYMMRWNFEPSLSLFHFALDRNVRFIYASSASVYGATAYGREEPLNERPLNAYATSKLMFDNYVRKLTRRASNSIVGLRYFNVYGPGEDHKGPMASMPHQAVKQIQTSGVVHLFGSYVRFGGGEQTRDFVAVSDIVSVNMHFLAGNSIQRIVNVGSGFESSWNSMANEVIRTLGNGRIGYKAFSDSLKGKYQYGAKADLTTLRELGYAAPMMHLAEGIRGYVSALNLIASSSKLNSV